MELVRPRPEWSACIVAASGPSLTAETAEAVAASGLPVLAVNDAYKRLPQADILYACDAAWWRERFGARDFAGERWSSIGRPGRFRHNDKSKEQRLHDLRLVFGADGTGFSFDPETIHYGSNSGFQGVNLALLLGASVVILVGFDMRGSHFFGAHKQPLRNTSSYANFIRAFDLAAKKLPSDRRIINATPGSALGCFPRMDLHDALAEVSRSRIAA